MVRLTKAYSHVVLPSVFQCFGGKLLTANLGVMSANDCTWCLVPAYTRDIT